MAKRKKGKKRSVNAASSYWSENFPGQMQQMVQQARESGNYGEVFRSYFTSPEFIDQFRKRG